MADCKTVKEYLWIEWLTGSASRFMAASKVLGEETIAGSAGQQQKGSDT